MSAQGRHMQKLQEGKSNGKPFHRLVPGHFHLWREHSLHTHAQFAHEMKKLESDHRLCELHFSCHSAKWHTAITVRCHRGFAESAKRAKNQNSEGWMACLGNGTYVAGRTWTWDLWLTIWGLPRDSKSSPTSWNKWQAPCHHSGLSTYVPFSERSSQFILYCCHLSLPKYHSPLFLVT